jgi:hypothetical protein
MTGRSVLVIKTIGPSGTGYGGSAVICCCVEAGAQEPVRPA